MAYYRGDYYRHPIPKGDYYRGHGRGDPFWGAILRGIGSVVGAALGIPKITTAPLPAPGGGVTPPFALMGPQGMGTTPEMGVAPSTRSIPEFLMGQKIPSAPPSTGGMRML